MALEFALTKVESSILGLPSSLCPPELLTTISAALTNLAESELLCWCSVCKFDDRGENMIMILMRMIKGAASKTPPHRGMLTASWMAWYMRQWNGGCIMTSFLILCSAQTAMIQSQLRYGRRLWRGSTAARPISRQ